MFTARRKAGTEAGRTAIDWLGHDQHSASVLTTARNLLSIEQTTRRLLPPALARHCRVAKLDRQQLTLVVPGAAHAARLRQMTPRIQTHLVASGWNLNEIIVKIQADISGGNDKTAPIRQAQPLDQQALAAFADLHNQLPDGPLANAVQRLLQRHQLPA